MFLREGTSFERALQVAATIRDVPGVARVSCGFKCNRDLGEMGEVTVSALAESGDFESFKVHARRNHTDFETDSMQMNQIIGSDLCAAFPDKKVKMKDPDATVVVEVVQNAAYIYARSERGVGGLPVGSSGRVMCLLSSGIDSPVALWKMARRGAVCIGVHFSGRPQTADTSEYLVDDIARVLEKTGCIARVYVVPFGDYQKEIALKVPPSWRGASAQEPWSRARAWARSRRRPSTTFGRRTKLSTCPSSVRSSAATNWPSSRMRSAWERSTSRRRTRPTAARCSCPAIPRRMRRCPPCWKPNRCFPWTSGFPKSWNPPNPTTTPAHRTVPADNGITADARRGSARV